MSKQLEIGTPLKGQDLTEFLELIKGEDSWDESQIYTFHGYEIRRWLDMETKKDFYYEVFRNLATGETIKVGETRYFDKFMITFV